MSNPCIELLGEGYAFILTIQKIVSTKELNIKNVLVLR